MADASLTMAKQIAQAARAFQQERTGHAPKAVTVVLSEDTLVITLHEALSPAEKALARSETGAAQVQEFHRQLFSDSCETLRAENSTNHRRRGARSNRTGRADDRGGCAGIHHRYRCTSVSAGAKHVRGRVECDCPR